MNARYCKYTYLKNPPEVPGLLIKRMTTGHFSLTKFPVKLNRCDFSPRGGRDLHGPGVQTGDVPVLPTHHCGKWRFILISMNKSTEVAGWE